MRLNGLSPPQGNPRRGFKLMKSAQVRATLSMTRAMRDGADERCFGKKIAPKCITTVDNVMTPP
jgi:hypothetical protein